MPGFRSQYNRFRNQPGLINRLQEPTGHTTYTDTHTTDTDTTGTTDADADTTDADPDPDSDTKWDEGWTTLEAESPGGESSIGFI